MRFALALSLCVACGCLRIPPAPPAPEPAPEPPVVDVTPAPSGPLCVLIVEETADRRKLPASQVRIFTSTKVQGWLRQNAPNRWRIWDKDVDLSKAPAEFREAMKVPRESLPWIVISNGADAFSGPLPKTEADTLKLLEGFKP